MSTTMPEPFATIQTAVIAQLLAQDITCYDHMPFELYGVPSAYLVPTDAQADYGRADQGEVAIGATTYALRYFVSLEGSERAASVQSLEGVRAIYRAFHDATLGGAVRDARIDRMSIDPVEFGRDARPMLMVEADITIKPRTYPVT